MNIRDTLKALVYFLREGHQSGNTTAALHGVAHVGPAPGKDWEHPRLVYLSEQDAKRSMQAYKVPCMSLSDPHRLRTRRPGPVVFDTWTVEQLAEKALQRIQVLEKELGEAREAREQAIDTVVNLRAQLAGAEAEARVFSQELCRLRSASVAVEVPELTRGRYFWSDPESCSFEFVDSEEEARKKAEESVRIAIDEAGGEDPTRDELAICYGVILGRAKEIPDPVDANLGKLVLTHYQRHNAIDSSRILKDGEVAVREVEWNAMYNCACLVGRIRWMVPAIAEETHADISRTWRIWEDARKETDALRSGEAEGRKG